MFEKNKDAETIFQRKLEKKIKDSDLVAHLTAFYDKQIEEMVISLFLYHLSKNICLSDEFLTKYSFLFRNEHYIEAIHKQRLIKVRDLSKFELFEIYFERHFEDLKTEFEGCENFAQIIDDKNEMIEEFHKTKELNEAKERYLKLRKEPIGSRIMDVCTFLFLGICMSLIYQVGLNSTTISIAVGAAVTFNFIQSAGEYFEKVRFKYRINKILPKTFIKSINAISSIYLTLYLVFTSFILGIITFSIAMQADIVFGFEQEYIGEVIAFCVSYLAGYWQFRKAVYNQRYFMFKKLEESKSKDDMYVFYNSLIGKKKPIKNKTIFQNDKL